MANIIKKPSSLEKECNLWRKKGKNGLIMASVFFVVALVFGAFSAIGSTVSLISPVLSVIFALSFTCLAVFLVIANIFLIRSLYCYNRAKILFKGIIGETDTADIIATLPEDYFGFQNVVVRLDDKISEIDIVIVGPTGVFVVETKNRNGKVTGSYEQREWKQHKVGRRGTPYISNFYSPVKQVSTHIYRLTKFLRNNGICVHIDGAVYFSNREATVKISGSAEKIPVFSYSNNGEKSLKNYILGRKTTLSNETIKKICNLL